MGSNPTLSVFLFASEIRAVKKDMTGKAQKHKLIGLIKNYNYKTNQKIKSKEYEFKPLKNKDGFIVYSKEKYNNNAKIKEFYSNYEYLKEKCLHRFYYYKHLKNIDNSDEKILTIIMLNPAFADSTEPDQTISNIEKFLKLEQINEHKFTAFEIINLYSVRIPKSAKLNEILKVLGNDKNLNLNEKFIKSFIELSCAKNSKRTLLAAWGASHHKKAMELFNDKKGFLNCYALTKKTKRPRHFSSCSYNRVNDKDKNINNYINI